MCVCVCVCVCVCCFVGSLSKTLRAARYFRFDELVSRTVANEIHGEVGGKGEGHGGK